ncbi:hypothetical protein J5X84_01645 [Streptosporangiaceae bacterium NEAU-GS5]|nr:hypothetical protein [Streptosporangiaceae bacterium NEAU-GS5]
MPIKLDDARLGDLSLVDDEVIADLARRLMCERSGTEDPLARFDAGL